MIPLEGIPGSLAAMSDGWIVTTTIADTPTIQIISAANGSIRNQIQIGSIGSPMSIMPVNGEGNGFLVCVDTVDGLDWFLCGHQLEVTAARSLEEPVCLRSLRTLSGLVPDPFGSYVAFSTAQSAIRLFDSTFAFLQPVFPGSSSSVVEHPTALALDSVGGRVAIGQQNGVVGLYQLLRTRKTVDVRLCDWSQMHL